MAPLKRDSWIFFTAEGLTNFTCKQVIPSYRYTAHAKRNNVAVSTDGTNGDDKRVTNFRFRVGVADPWS